MRLLISLLLPLALVACGKSIEPPKPGEPQGRAETEGVRNVEVLGYSGGATASKVDGALDANDARKAELDAALDAQANPQ